MIKKDSSILTLSLYFLVAYGVFTLHVWFVTFWGWTFNNLLDFLWIPLGVSTVIVFYFSRRGLELEDQIVAGDVDTGFGTSNWLLYALSALLLMGALALTILKLDESFSVSWGAFAAAVGLLYLASYSYSVSQTEKNDRSLMRSGFSEGSVLILLGLVLVGLYLFRLSNNADDTHFVSYVVGLLENPDSPLFSRDTIFSYGGANVIFSLNYGQSWEVLTAVISTLFSVSHLHSYYVYSPLLFLLIVPVPVYFFTKSYFPRYALISTIFAMLMLVSWSTFNHLHGSFFIPRFFQGKAALLSVMLPMLLLVSRSFFRRPRLNLGIVTMLLLIGAGGVSSTGLYISLLVLGLSYLSFTPFSGKPLIKSALLAVLIMLPNLVMLGVVKSNIGQMHSLNASQQESNALNEVIAERIGGKVNYTENRPISSMYWLFGSNKYLFIILLMSGVTIAVLTRYSGLRLLELKRFYVVLAVVGFSHPLAAFLTNVVGPGNLIWRYHWGLPLGVVFSLFSAAVITYGSDMIRKKTSFAGASAIAVLPIVMIGLYFFAGSYQHLAKQYSLKPNLIKVNESAMDVAQYILENERVGGEVILAEDLVSEVIPMLIHNSKLVASRPLYWLLPYFSPDEKNKRRYLQRLINEPGDWDKKDVDFFSSEIKARNITVLVFQKTTGFSIDKNFGAMADDYLCSERNQKWTICGLR